MKRSYFLLFYIFCAFISHGKPKDENSNIKTISIYPDKIINQFDQNPIGININYFIDNDKINHPTNQLSQTIKKMGVKFLRYPGGDKSDNNLFSVPPYRKADPHLSRLGKGASLGRKDFLTNNESNFKYIPLDFDKFMALCKKTGCEPIIVVPCDTRKNIFPSATYISSREQLIEHAAEWVRYANKKHNYKIKYWMVGNESWNSAVKYGGYSAKDYAEDIRDFSDAMKKVDSSIKIIPNVTSEDEDYSKSLFEIAKGKFDLLCISNYPVRTFKNGYSDWASNTNNLIFPFKGVTNQIDKFGTEEQKKNMQIIVAEFGPFDWWDGWGSDGDIGHAMCNFDILGKLLEQPRMKMSCFWNTRWLLEPNKWPGYNALDNNNNMHPIGYSIAFWAKYLYPKMVQSNVSSSNSILSYATFSESQKSAYVYVLNQLGLSQDIELIMNHKKINKISCVAYMSGTNPHDMKPEISMVETTKSNKLQILPYSITVFKIAITEI